MSRIWTEIEVDKHPKWAPRICYLRPHNPHHTFCHFICPITQSLHTHTHTHHTYNMDICIPCVVSISYIVLLVLNFTQHSSRIACVVLNIRYLYLLCSFKLIQSTCSFEFEIPDNNVAGSISKG